ncbi:hypothetical protein ABZ915_17585 [Streptomyces sp. NPDC046915]|uniref:hypothetical protein n=1 Tax=Streptomyces sp. NPDC046915 TaxID=3155257 RepID=UPI0033F82523
MNCQLYDGISINGTRPECPPAVARLTHHHGGTTALCQHHFDDWLDTADNDESIEPKNWEWITA